ncbi:MAG: nucleotidyltransferase domain-containing protein [Rhodococcus sp. (in: high G+C Gram-positive bacteria)]|uniref:nucleotidyltransferase family protein n=1 Tax=Rhodococcus sp. TaxID=1831 RepID=UPI003BB729C1
MTERAPSFDSRRLRSTLRAHRTEIVAVLDRYGAYDVTLFGSVARGDAGPRSDIDLMISIDAPEYEQIVSMLGLADELSELLGVKVDAVARGVATERVNLSARVDMLDV